MTWTTIDKVNDKGGAHVHGAVFDNVFGNVNVKVNVDVARSIMPTVPGQ